MVIGRASSSWRSSDGMVGMLRVGGGGRKQNAEGRGLVRHAPRSSTISGRWAQRRAPFFAAFLAPPFLVADLAPPFLAAPFFAAPFLAAPFFAADCPPPDFLAAVLAPPFLAAAFFAPPLAAPLAAPLLAAFFA